ncbi:SdpI family protein [Bacillus sp. OAE603]|uniref:SdpI family protein n=1 Tax=Gottfriedia sp. OAE603 TaxID=2663872 RepID=UPI00178A0BEF
MDNISSYFISLLIPFIMIIIGFVHKIRAPKKINHFFGYRTFRSMSSQKAWDHAQKLLSYYSIRFGFCNSVISLLLLYLLPYSLDEITLINLGVSMIFLFIPIFFIENKLKRSFQ